MDAYRNLCGIYGNNIVTEHTSQQRILRFRDGETQIKDQFCCRMSNELESDDLLVTLEDEDKFIVAELSERFQVHRTTIEKRIRTMDYIVKSKLSE